MLAFMLHQKKICEPFTVFISGLAWYAYFMGDGNYKSISYGKSRLSFEPKLDIYTVYLGCYA